VKQQHTSTATSILTTKSTYRSQSAQRLPERTVYPPQRRTVPCYDVLHKASNLDKFFNWKSTWDLTCAGLVDLNQFHFCIDRIPAGARFFAHFQTGPGAHPASCRMGAWFFSGIKRPERGADRPPLLAPRSRKSRVLSLPTLWAFESVTGWPLPLSFTTFVLVIPCFAMYWNFGTT
jgi:hypothetical protein